MLLYLDDIVIEGPKPSIVSDFFLQRIYRSEVDPAPLGSVVPRSRILRLILWRVARMLTGDPLKLLDVVAELAQLGT